MDLKAFREDFPDIYEGVAALVNTATSSIKAETEGRVGYLEKTVLEAKREAFIKALSDAVPGWQNMSHDPNWSVWLAERHYGKTKLQLLQEASASFDAQAAINLIVDYRQPDRGASPRTPSSPRQAEEGVKRSFIKEFYQAVTRGRYRGREKEKEAIQARIDRAIAAGKVLNG
jgi:hypothetical protein